MAISQAIASVVAVVGEVFARNADGEMRTLKPGDVLLEGEVILTSAGANVELQFAANGEHFSIDSGQVVTLTTELVSVVAPTAADGTPLAVPDVAVAETSQQVGDATIEQVIQALEQGGDLQEVLQATAAGGGAAGEGHSFVRLLRISEGVNPAGFGFGPGGGAGGPAGPQEEAGNLPPIVADDAVTTNEDTAVVVDVLANDTDPNGEPLEVIAVTQGGNGTVTLDPTTGNPVYTPKPDYFGPDVFTYTASDPFGNTGTATVLVNVLPVNDAPIARPDVRTVGEDIGQISGNVITAPHAGEQADTDIDSEVLTVVGIAHGVAGGAVGTAISGDYGTLIVNADGSYRYQPGPAAQALDDGESVVDVFNYQISDGELTSAATLSITVTGTNDVPIANPDMRTTTEDVSISGNVITAPNVGEQADFDVDNEALSVVGVAFNGAPAAVGAPIQGEWGTLILNPNGGYSYIPNAAAQGMAEGESHTENFAYTISDGTATASTVLSITVVGTNDGPVANPDFRTIDEDASGISGNVITAPILGEQADIDIDSDALSVVAVNGAAANVGSALAGALGTLTLGPSGTYTYVPNAAAQSLAAGESRDEVFSYTITDGSATATTTLTITVTGTNDAPIAVGETGVTNEDTPITIPVLDNDSDIDGDVLTVVAIAGQPVTVGGSVPVDHGTATLNPGGTITFTPDADYNGPATIGYTVSDGAAAAAAVLSINVLPVNDVPVARGDVATTNENTPVAIDVLANDFDLDGDVLSVTAIDGQAVAAGDTVPVSNGTATLNADGSITFNPEVNYSGPADFTYTVSDGAATDTAEVSVIVVEFNQPPPGAGGAIANPDVRTVGEDSGGISGNVVTAPQPGEMADTNLRGEPLPGAQITAVDGSAGNVGAALAGAMGTLTLNADGSYTYVPNAAAQALDDGESQREVYSYTVASGNSTSTTTLTITVTGSNDGPIAVADVGTTNEDTPVTVTVLANDSDVEGDVLSVIAIDGQGVVAGDTVDVANGTATLNADDTITFTPNANYNGPADFQYTITDGTATDTATVSITVGGVNDMPVAVNDMGMTPEDTAITLNVLANDTDLDGDVLSVTHIDGNAATVGTPIAVSHGTATLNADGTITFNPDANYNGPALFDYTITDGTASESAGVAITVTPVNDAPVAVNDMGTTPEDTAITLNVLANDTDLDGDTLSVTHINGAVATVGVPIGVSHGTATLNADGTITFNPDANYNGPALFDYTITDGTASDSAGVAIDVGGVNDVPVAVNDMGMTPEDTAITVNVLANDTDLDGDALSVTHIDGTPAVVGTPIGVSHGTATLNADGTITFDPDANYNGPALFDYTITDGAASDSAAVAITVTPVNDAPVAVNDMGITPEDTAITVNVLANDTDLDGDTLSVTHINGTVATVGTPIGVSHGSATLNADGTITFNPDANYNGPALFDYTITDGTASDSAAVAITVTPVNELPSVGTATATVSEEGLAGLGIPDTEPVGLDTTDSASVTSADLVHSTGPISIADLDLGDTVTVSLRGPADGAYTSNGVNIIWRSNADGTGSTTGPTLYGLAGGLLIATASINDAGEYAFQLSGPIDHLGAGEDMRDIPFSVLADDGTGVTEAAGALTVTVEDDQPYVSGTMGGQLEIPTEGGTSSYTATLGVQFGADGASTTVDSIQLSGTVDGSGYVLDGGGSRLTADGEYLVYQSDGNGGLLAVKESDPGHVAFSVSVDPDSDSYTVTVVDGIDGASHTEPVALNNANEDIHGGHTELVTVDMDFDDNGSVDAYMRVTATAYGEPSTVNYNSNALGVAEGAKVNPGDELRIEFRDIGSGDYSGAEPFIALSQADATFWNLGGDETGSWTAIRHDGGVETVVGSGEFTQADLVNGVLNIDPDGGQFDTLLVSSGDAGNGFGVAELELTTSQVVPGFNYDTGFTFVATDADGDTDTGAFAAAFVGAEDQTVGVESKAALGSEDTGIGGGLIGGAEESDAFAWPSAGEGEAGAPAVDTLHGMAGTEAAGGGEMLDLRDLLQGEDTSALDSYLHFEQAGGDTVVHISTTGGFADGYDPSFVDQQIVLQGVDLTNGGALITDVQIIQDLLHKGTLLTD